jgi:Uncharacterized conserved protein
VKQFDYSFLDERIVDSSMLDRILKIQKFKGKAEEIKGKAPDIFTELEFIAKIQSVKGSNAIEGIVTSDERIAAIVNQRSVPKNHDEMEIAGYRDVLNLIHNEHKTIQISEATILGFHEMLTSYLPRVGEGYKKNDNVIVEISSTGQRKVRFRPVPADETENAMQQMILAYYAARDNHSINPLLLIPCFILDFLCIHPFPDGNGRMSRLLSLLMMYREGLDIGKYISFEEQINRSKERYYGALETSSQRWHENENDYVLFIEDFIGTLYLCYKELDRRFITIGDKKVNKTNRIEAAVLNSILPISKKEICEFLPDISMTTVEAVLSRLTKDGKIKKIGGNRNARYFRNK